MRFDDSTFIGSPKKQNRHKKSRPMQFVETQCTGRLYIQ